MISTTVLISLLAASFALADMSIFHIGLKQTVDSCYKSSEFAEKFCEHLAFKSRELMAQNDHHAFQNNFEGRVAQLNFAIKGAMAAGPTATEIMRAVFRAEGRNAAEIIINSINRSGSLYAEFVNGRITLTPVKKAFLKSPECDQGAPITVEEVVEKTSDDLLQYAETAQHADQMKSRAHHSVALEKRVTKSDRIIIGVVVVQAIFLSLIGVLYGLYVGDTTAQVGYSVASSCMLSIACTVGYILNRISAIETEAGNTIV